MTATKRGNSGGKAGRRSAAAALLGFSLCLAGAQELPPVDSFRCDTCAYPEFRAGNYSVLEEPIIDPACDCPFPNNRIPQSRLLAHGAWPEDIYQRNRRNWRVFVGTAGRVARRVAEGWTPLHEAVSRGSYSHPRGWPNPAHLDRVLDAWPDALNSGLRNGPAWIIGRTPLHLALPKARQGSVEWLLAVEMLLARGASVNARAADGQTPLHLANSREAFEALRAAGADIRAQSDWGNTVLQRAAFAKDAATVRELLAAGLNPNAATSDGRTPLHFAGSLEVFEELRAAGANIRAQTERGETVLHRAASGGDAATVRELLAAGLNPNAERDDGFTPLHFARSREIFEALRANGANLSVLEAAFSIDELEAVRTGAGSRSLLQAAIRQVGRNLDSAWLPHLRAVNPDFHAVSSNFGRSSPSNFPLHYAATSNEDPAAITALIGDASAKPGYYNVDATTGGPILQAAGFNGNPAVVAALLEAGASAESTLYQAALNETPRAAEIVRVLLEAGASVEGGEPWYDGRVRRPVYAAAMVQNLATLDALLEAGANVNVEGSTDDYSLLADVLSRGRFDCGYGPVADRLRSAGARAVQFTESGEVPFTPGPPVAECDPVSAEIRALIDSGADLGVQDERGETALHRAAAAGQIADIQALVAAGAEIDAASRGGGLRALHFAIWRRAGLATVTALLEAGADVNARDSRGGTALHWAARLRQVEPAVVEALLAAGAEVHARDNLGRTALDYATRANIGNEAVAALLRAAGEN